jgi:hypothetical protein
MEGGGSRLEVVFPGPDAEPQGEPTPRQRVDAGRLLRQHTCPAQRSDEHRGHQAHPLGHRRGRGQRDEGLVIGVDQPVDDPEAGERTGIRPPGPVQD